MTARPSDADDRVEMPAGLWQVHPAISVGETVWNFRCNVAPLSGCDAPRRRGVSSSPNRLH